MQLRKIVAAGSIGALMTLATAAYAVDLSNYPQPFITATGSPDFLVVVGEKAAPSDVVGAIDVAARLGSQSVREVSVGGTVAGLTVSGEGKSVATGTKKVFLDDSLGKTGLRTTFTKDDLPTLLKSGTFQDRNGTSINYNQFVYLTPSSTTNEAYKIQFDLPGGVSGADPDYNFGRFPIGPLNTNYLYKTAVNFEKDVSGTAVDGRKITLFGREYTFHPDTSDNFAGSTPQVVLQGSSETVELATGEMKTVTIAGTSFDVTFTGAESSIAGVVKVGAVSDSLSEGQSRTIGGLDVYLDDVQYLGGSTNPQLNRAKLLLGAEKLIFKHGSKVTKQAGGGSETSIDGTYVELTASSSNLATITVYGGGKRDEDYLKVGGTYVDPIWKDLKIAFSSVMPAKTDASRNLMKVEPSGDNEVRVTFTEQNGNTATLTWAVKSSSSVQNFDMADGGRDGIVTVENVTVGRDNYIVLSSGDFPHLYEVSSVDTTAGSSTAKISLKDVFSGVSTDVQLGASTAGTKVIDGQTYYFNGVTGTANTFRVTWGTGAANNNTGTYTTVFATLKGKNGERLAMVNQSATVTVSNGTWVQLPSGAIKFNLMESDTLTSRYNITAATQEDGTASACSAAPCVASINLTGTTGANLTLGLTTATGVQYTVTGSSGSANIRLIGEVGDGVVTQPALLLVEEKDDAGDQNSVMVQASSTLSSGNYQADAGAPQFTAAEYSASKSGSNVDEYVDIYGVYARRDTSGQDKVWAYYPDDQVVASVFVLAKDATVTSAGGSSATKVKEAVPVKTAVAALDKDVGQTEKNTRSMILVGGPCVNKLVAEVLNASDVYGKFPQCIQKFESMDYTAGTAMVKYSANPWGTLKAALIVAGHDAADTRAATSVLMKYDDYSGKLTGTQIKVAGATVTSIQ